VAQSDSVEALYAKLTPEVRPLMEELRALIAEVMPNATEGVHLGWTVIHYRHGGSMRDMIVALSPQRAYVNLEFADGAELPDPAHRLEGTGKRMRHVKIHSSEDARNPAVRVLLGEAARRRGLA
jgi:hypothetical protein